MSLAPSPLVPMGAHGANFAMIDKSYMFPVFMKKRLARNSHATSTCGACAAVVKMATN